jgi:hypothetical protein
MYAYYNTYIIELKTRRVIYFNITLHSKDLKFEKASSIELLNSSSEISYSVDSIKLRYIISIKIENGLLYISESIEKFNNNSKSPYIYTIV